VAHNHRLEENRNSRKALWLAFLITLVFMIVEVTGGLISGSLALLADAGHMLTDVAALALAIVAARLAESPPTPRRTFGFLRAEVIGAFLNGAFLVVIVGFIAWEAWKRLGQQVVIDGPLMMVVAVLGLAANLACAKIMSGSRRININIQGAYLHVLGDALGSLGALAAGTVILATGWTPVDTIVSMGIAVIILWSSVRLLGRTLNIIINATPEDIEYEEVKRELLAIEHFADLHDLHIWNISTGFPVLSVHVRLKPSCSDSTHWQKCLQDAQAMLREKFGIVHSTLQLEPADYEKDNRSL